MKKDGRELKMEKKNEIGIIISREGPPTHLKFTFQIAEDKDIKVGEYVEVPAGKYVIIGRITEVKAFNQFFKNPEFVRDHLLKQLPVTARFPVNIGRWRAAEVRIVGMFEEEKIHPPNIAPEPGERVYKADKNILTKLMGLKEDGAFIGTMYGNPEIKVKLDIEKLVRLHIAILGATGTGKSYTVGVLIEELLEHNFPVVVIDPHGEYYTFQYQNDEKEDLERLKELNLNPKTYNVKILSPVYQGTGELTLNFNSLNADAMAEICQLSTVMKDLLYLAMKSLKEKQIETIDPETLLQEVEKIAREWGFARSTQLSLKRRISILKEIGIFGKGLKPEEIVKPRQLTIIDVSEEMEEHIRRIFVGSLLNELFNARKEEKIPPLMVVVEESHRFAPQDEETYSKTIMRKIAREGRKFGIGLCITSQRIVGLDKDVISQCGTKIILRIDSKTDLDYIRPYIDYTTAEDFQRIPYLPTGTAAITGVTAKYPIITQIRPRKTKHLTTIEIRKQINKRKTTTRTINKKEQTKTYLHEFIP